MNQLKQFNLRRHIAFLSLLVCFAVKASADITIDGLVYQGLNDGWQVIGYDASIPSDVVIPSSIESKAVIYISNSAFRNCKTMTSITIPASVTGINGYPASDYSAFEGCTSLRTIRIEDGDTPLTIKSIGHSFNDCPIEELYLGRPIIAQHYIGSSVYSLRESLFSSNLSKVTIGPKVTELADYLFQKTSISTITLPNVKSIGNYTFQDCDKLVTANLGNNLESIGSSSFQNCSNMTKLTLPDATKIIGNSAFKKCTSITEVTLGEGLRVIGDEAFGECSSLTGVILPDNCISMGGYAFSDCLKLTVAKLGKTLTEIPSGAFMNCIALSEINVPASVTSIGYRAFYNDSTLATITMEEGLQTIDNEVFYNNSGLVQMQIPGTVTKMGYNCFYGCTHISYLTFRDGDEPLVINNAYSETCQSSSSCEYDYFYDCPIRFLSIGRDITYKYSNSATVNGNRSQHSAPFANKKSIVSVTFGPKVTMAYHNLLYGCSGIQRLTFPSGFQTAHSYSLAACTGLKEVVFPETLTTLDSYACIDDTCLNSVTFLDDPTGENTLTINNNVFANCTNIEELVFPERLVLLGGWACKNNRNLSSVVFKEATDNNLLFQIGEYTFSNCPGLTSLTFPAKTTSIGDNCFYNTANLKEITFTDSPNAISLGNNSPLFAPSRLQKLYIGRNIDYTYNSSNSPFYNQNELTDVSFSQAGTVTYCKDYLLYKVDHCRTLILPESLLNIGNYAFSEMLMLDNITVPGNVGNIGNYAFAGCTAMQSATVIANNKTTMGNSVFSDCTSLEHANIGNGVTEMGTYVFQNDSSMVSVKLSASCPWLKEGLFYHCDSLASITIPAAVTKMDTKMFAYCSSLKDVTFEDNSELLTMGYGASSAQNGLFSDSPVERLKLGRWLSYDTGAPSRSPFYSIATLKDITFGEHVGLVDKYMFSYCTGLEEVYLPDNIESVGLWGFRGCTALKHVRLSEKLSQISDYGFSGCTMLDNVVFPNSMTSVADNSFSGCTSLKKLDLGNSLYIIGPSAFKNCTALEGIRIPDALYALGVESFRGCTSLPNVTIRSITSVGKQAFQDCTGLQWVSLSEKTTSLGENSFDGCTGIKYVKSYATFPPEGLVNFPQAVTESGTVFVPEGSEEYYRYSPTWETWFDIRPLTDNILVSAVTLDKSDISFKAAETVQLTATVTGEGATDTNVLWRSANEDVASVDANGLVTAVSVGETEITALAADGSGQKDVCHVEVLPTLVESIAIQGAQSLKKNHTMELTTVVLPATATNAAVRWTSSNNAVATVKANGTVTAFTAGNVTITATATDGSGISGTFSLAIVPPTKGDSNDNDDVTITDAVNTANYAVGNEVEDFCFEAADVNSDNRITLADASATVSLVLDQPLAADIALSPAKAPALTNTEAEMTDALVIGNYTAESNQETSIFVTLDSHKDYVALQADITVPEGMTLEDVKLGDRASATHSLMTKRFDSRTVRIALFSLNNTAFTDSDEALLEIVVKARRNACGRIEAGHILAADANAREYKLTAIGGYDDSVTGIDRTDDTGITIDTDHNHMTVHNARGHMVSIYTVNGTVLTRFKALSDTETRTILPGTYIVTVADKVAKIMVK